MKKMRESRYLFLLFLLPAVFITYSTVFTTGRLPGGEMSDTVAQGYPFFAYTESAMRGGGLPHWNPYIFCGVPFYSSFSAPVLYPLRWLLMISGGTGAVARFIFPLHMLLGGVFAWMFLGSIGVGRWGRIVGCIAFATTAWSNTLFYAGHGSKIICWSYLPLLLYSCEMWARTGRARYPAYGGFALGMQALASHPQMMLYSVMAAVVWTGYRVFSAGGSRWKNAGRASVGLLTVMLLGVAVGSVQLLPGYNFSRYSTRGEDLTPDQAESYSLPPEESLTMVFPHLFGYRHGFRDSMVSGVPAYFGRLGLRLSSEFLGVLVFLLAMAAFTGSPGRYRWPLLTVGLLGLIVSWGGYTPLFGLLYRAMPFFRKLRAPHMAAFLTTSALALSAGPGFDALFRGEGFPRRAFVRVILAFSAFCLLVFLAAGFALPGLQSAWWDRMGIPGGAGYSLLVDRRVDMAATDFLRAALVGLVLAGTVHFRKALVRGSVAVPGVLIALVIGIETIPIDRDFQVFLRETDVEDLLDEHPGVAELAGSGRLLPGGNDFMPDGVRSVLGYHAAKPAVAQDLQEMISSGGALAYRQTSFTVMQSQDGYIDYSEFRRMLLEQASSSDPSLTDTLQLLVPEDPLPRTFFAGSWVLLSRNSCISLLSGGLDPQTVTVLYDDPGLPDSLNVHEARATLIVDDPHRVVVGTDNPYSGLLVLADTWYPRWKVTIDGIPGKMLQANHWQRAVAVPAGTHEVEFVFDSSDVSTGLIVSMAGAGSILLMLAADLLISRRRERTG
ncbi:MAG: hypothetical protein AVO35_08115 [Candidatus Aegiribacteria sp. MLS_C]|nr:MAG: hypothetical protein AVO35_08115 [Candidatus Aegiribacteria sp. MLS_C]